MKILVTGGRGFIGSHLVRALEARGDQVTMWDLPDHDVTGSWEWEDYKNIDRVYHLAAIARVKASYSDPTATAKVNVGGTLNLLFGFQQCPVYVAGTLHRGDSPYAVSKVGAEDICRQFHMARVVRFGNVYGGGEGVIDKWMHANEIEIWGNGSTCKDFIHVDDVVSGLLNPSPKPISNLCTGRLISLEELASHFDKHVSYRSPQPGDWSTEKVTPDYSTTWTVEKYIKSRS